MSGIEDDSSAVDQSGLGLGNNTRSLIPSDVPIELSKVLVPTNHAVVNMACT